MKTKTKVAPHIATLITIGSLSGGAIGQTVHSITDFSFYGDSSIPRISGTYTGDPDNTLDFTASRVDDVVFGGTTYHFPSYLPSFGSDGLSIVSQPSPIAPNVFGMRIDFANPVSNLEIDFAGLTSRTVGGTLEYEVLTLDVVPDSVTTSSGPGSLLWDGAFEIRSGVSDGEYNGTIDFGNQTISSANLVFEYVGTTTAEAVDGYAIESITYTNTVPEPSSALLLGLGGLSVILRRRR